MQVEEKFQDKFNQMSKYFQLLDLNNTTEGIREPTSLVACGNFILEHNNFLGQFSSFYQDRLKKLKAFVNCNKKISNITAVKGKAIILGTLHKNYAKKRKEVVDDATERVYNDNDTVDLGDDSGNIKLLFTKDTFLDTGFFMIGGRQCHNITIHDIPHGIVCGVEGELNEKVSLFKCQRLFLPTLQPQKPLKVGTDSNHLRQDQFFQKWSDDDEIMMLTSSATVGQIQSISSYLRGATIQNQRVKNRIAKISSLVLCGFKIEDEKLSAGLWSLDQQLLSLTESMSGVFLMPNRDTLQGRTWPVRSMTGCQLPTSSKKIKKCTNPEVFRDSNGLTMIGTCGENIRDFPRICTITDQLTVMEYQLMFGHLAPNAPSTLQTEPSTIDTMVLTKYPHVYFSATQGPFRSKTITMNQHACKLLLIPPANQGVILLNQRTLDTMIITLT